MDEGAGACPRGSRVGGGRIVLDTGFEGPIRMVRNDVVLLNNRDELIFLTETTSEPEGVRAQVKRRKVIAECRRSRVGRSGPLRSADMGPTLDASRA